MFSADTESALTLGKREGFALLLIGDCSVPNEYVFESYKGELAGAENGAWVP